MFLCHFKLPTPYCEKIVSPTFSEITQERQVLCQMSEHTDF